MVKCSYNNLGLTMKKSFVFFLISSLILLSSCQNQGRQNENSDLCIESWYQSVELAIPSGDGKGHGPDLGSDEWKSVIEFKLDIRGNPEIPDRNSQEWCRYINDFI